MNEHEFGERVRVVLVRDISADPENWSEENPFWGTCAVLAVLVQDVFGGEILRASLDKTKYPAGSHYWNRLPDGEEVDFGVEQFLGDIPQMNGETRSREYILSFPGTVQRYELLVQRYLEEEQ